MLSKHEARFFSGARRGSDGRPLAATVRFRAELCLVEPLTLAPAPVARRVVAALGGGLDGAGVGSVRWRVSSAPHRLELASEVDCASLAAAGDLVRSHTARVRTLCVPLHAELLTGGAHPLLDPARHRLGGAWPESSPDSHAVFSLQGIHLGLVATDDAEAHALSAAVSLLQPLAPGLAAASPVLEGRLTGQASTRVALLAGAPARAPAGGSQGLDALLAPAAGRPPSEPEAGVRVEWVWALDRQESAVADQAALSCFGAVAHGLARAQVRYRTPVSVLDAVTLRCARDGAAALVDAPSLLTDLGLPRPLSAGAIWRELLDRYPPDTAPPSLQTARACLLRRGTLACRLARALGPEPSRARIQSVYSELCAAGAAEGWFGV